MKTTRLRVLPICVALIAAGCGGDSDGDSAPRAGEPGAERSVDLWGEWDPRLSPEELEQGRLDASWQRVVQLDTAGLTPGAATTAEAWDQITVEAVNDAPMQLPVYRSSEGPSALRVQILLDRAYFSPGVIDGRWGKNTEKAVYWFQHREGLRRTGWVDQETFDRLAALGGSPRELVRAHTLTQVDVEGPFVTIPEDIYEKAALDCSCYESLSEKLAELFHTTPEVLAQLNPGVDLDSLSAGSELQVPVVRDEGMAARRGGGNMSSSASTSQGATQPAAPGASPTGQVARLVVSAEGFYVHALDSSGRILYHFPTTLGSSFDPSPSGDHHVTKITYDPWWHYQPSILEHVDDDDEEATIPAGPNNAVGVVWMALSIPHYGIHGTSAPETIGYTTSAGCVRLTNWDALFLADRIQEGTPVEFSATAPAGPRAEG